MEQRQDNRTKAAAATGACLSIRAELHVELRVRDLALFNLAIDSKLRGCDLVAVRVDDSGATTQSTNVRQNKTGRAARFELSEQTRPSLDAYCNRGRKPGQVLFLGRGGSDRSLTTRQYTRLVERWVAIVGL